MSWRDRITKLLMGRERPPEPAWPPQLGPVDPGAPRASTGAYLITEPGAGLRYTFGDAPPKGLPSPAQMNVNRGGGAAEVLPFIDPERVR